MTPLMAKNKMKKVTMMKKKKTNTQKIKSILRKEKELRYRMMNMIEVFFLLVNE